MRSPLRGSRSTSPQCGCSTVRTPTCSQFLLGAGQACLLQDWVSGPSNLLSFWPLYLRRSPREDAAMRARFGAAWEAWAARTGGVHPRP